MRNASLKLVTLPDGKRVSVSDEPQTWWIQDGASGYINPQLIAPDPDQPRKRMDPAKLTELKESIRIRGVRDPPTLTPRSLAPWVKLPPEHDKLPFICVSGHRRRRCSLEVKLLAVPVRIVVYESEQDYRLDASVLNRDRDDLTPMEEGWEILRLSRSGITIEKIAKSYGVSTTHVASRKNLTQLLPAIQQLLDPSLSVKKRLPVTVGGELGNVPSPNAEELEALHLLFHEHVWNVEEPALAPRKELYDMGPELLRFELQKVLLAVIRGRGMNSAQALEVIHEHRVKLQAIKGTHRDHSDRFQPRKRKEILANLAGGVTGSTVTDWTPDEFRRIFDQSEPQEVEAYRVMLHGAAANLTLIEEILARIRDTKNGIDPKVTRLVKKST